MTRAKHKLDKASRKRDKISRRYTGFGFAGRKDLASVTRKYMKAERRYNRKQKKAEKWMAKMDETFSNVKVSSLK